jgi:hypothetical protein
VLIVALSLAVLVLAGAAAMLLPIFTHQSAGGSGQELPEGFVPDTQAVGADGRTRTLSVETLDGEAADLSQVAEGDELVVRGTGYDPAIGIYVSICLIPSVPGEKPSPCLGGIPEGAQEADGSEAPGTELEATSSAWITDDWAWRAFATAGYDDAETGTFEVRLLVSAPVQDGLDCTKSLCAITTRADHTASSDRVQDMQLPVAFAG